MSMTYLIWISASKKEESMTRQPRERRAPKTLSVAGGNDKDDNLRPTSHNPRVFYR